MRKLATLADRLLLALLIASGVMLLTAGLLSYAPSAFSEVQTLAPVGNGDPLLTLRPTRSVRPTPGHTGSPPRTANPLQTHNPLQTDSPRPTDRPGPTPAATPSGDRGFASRITIPSLQIDLPVVPGDLVVPGNDDLYPLCDVAMFMREFVQPGNEGATYIYAHAQRGMFAPLLKASEVNDGASMIGALIEVYTSDNKLHLYELYRVKRHATDLSLADPPPGIHMLVLQTSEGVSGTIPKLQVAARPLSVVPTTTAEANPLPQPRVCLPH